jgi:hypothetical protein
MTINSQWGDDKSRWKNPSYLQWLKEIWHVEIKEQARHLWPGQWTINGYWEDEKQLYKKYEREWEKSCQEAWEKKHPRKATDDSLSLQTLANGDALLNEGEDYFHWNVETPSWSMHRDGSWQKMLIDMRDWKGKTRDQYPGIFNSYEHACKTLAEHYGSLAPRFALGELADYEKHLKDFVDNYAYDR